MTHLRSTVVRIEALGKAVFGAYQPSRINTQNSHPLYYLTDIITHVWGEQSLHRFLQEGSHKLFKSVNAKGSDRGRSGMDKSVGTY